MSKRSKNRKLSRQGKIAVQAAALGLCVVGGSLALPKVGHSFRPIFAFSNVLRQNQIIFPDQEKQSSLLGNGDGASDALTEDKTADEARRPDANAGTQDSIQLDGTVPDGAVLPDGAIAPDDGASTGGTGGIAFLPGGSGGDGTIVIPGGQIIPLPDKDGDGTGGTGGGSVPSTPGDPGSVTPGGGGGSDGGGGGGAEAPDMPDTPVVPGDGAPAAPDTNIDYDDLPTEDYIKGDIFDKNTGIIDPDTAKYNYSLLVIQDDMGFRPNLAHFYKGQEITAADFFQTAVFQIKEGLATGGTNQVYRVTDFGPNFRIGEFDPVVSGDSVTVTFYYRLNQDSPWQTVETTFPVEQCEVQLLVGDYDSEGTLTTAGYGKPVRLYPSGREGTFDLSRYFYRAQPIQFWGDAAAPISERSIDRLCVGWAASQEDAAQGITVGNLYETRPDQHGLIELYPVFEDVPEGFTAELTPRSDYYLSGSLNNDEFSFSTDVFYQTITEIPGDDSVELPRGTQVLSAMGSVNTISIPDTLLYMSFSGLDDDSFLTVYDGYQADPGNEKYASTEDGLMYNKDMTRLLGIPSRFDKPITVPAEVSQVVVPLAHSVPSLIFLADTPPAVNTEQVSLWNRLYPDWNDPNFWTFTPSPMDIYFPKSAAVSYFALFSQAASDGGCNLYTLGETGTEDSAPVSFAENNGLITSKDGTVLYSIRATVSGTCVLPEGITTIAAGALSDAWDLTTLVLPRSLTALEEGSLVGWFRQALFLGDTPPALEGEVFDLFSPPEVLVRTEAADAYAAAWGETQPFTAAGFGAYVQDGWSFLLLPQGDGVDATLLHAPTGLTEFNEHTLDGILPDGAVLTTIDKYAFEGCENMTLAVFPASVTAVNDYAFWGCTSLEGIFFAARDSITVSDCAFYIADRPLNKGNLRFVALQAQCASFSSSFSDYYTPYYFPQDSTGYPDPGYYGNIKCYGPGYQLEEQGSGAILYSEPSLWKYSDQDPDPAGDDLTRVLCAATTGVSGDIDLSGVIWINQSAFYQCPNAFTLSNADHVWIVGYEAFLASGLTGELVLPDVRTIGSSAFQRTGITSADLSSPKLEVIDDFAFSECTQLAALTLDLDSALSAIGSNAFQLTALTSFTVPANVTMLGNDVVSGCPLSSMTFLSAEAPHLNFYHSKPIYLYQKLDSNENVLGPDPDFRVVLAGDAAGHEMDYLFAWRDAMSPFDQDPYETDLLAGENNARQVLGLERVTEITPDPNEEGLPELPALPEMPEIPEMPEFPEGSAAGGQEEQPEAPAAPEPPTEPEQSEGPGEDSKANETDQDENTDPEQPENDPDEADAPSEEEGEQP